MSRANRISNVIGVTLPFIAFLAAILLLWNEAIGWPDLVIFAVLYVATVLGISVGYHRLFTHKAFEARAPVRIGFAALGSMAVQGPVIRWVADHRKHHAFADDDGDPHSPHGHGGAIKGLFWAHVGWLFMGDTRAEEERFAPDLLEDRGLRLVNALFLPLALLGIAIPFGLGWLMGGTVAAGLLAAFWAGPVRIFFVHHVTWSVNSVCHYFGRRRFQTADQSTNVWWLAIPSMGESWHHNHHAFPRSASHGLRRWEIDLGALLIAGLEKLKLVKRVVRIDPERQSERERTGIRQVRIDSVDSPSPQP